MEYPTKGFIYGVGKHDVYLKSAKISACTVKDYYPDANITLVVPRTMVDKECFEIFDRVICDDSVPNTERTKLWALAKTPYDLTMYLDADTFCVSEEIRDVWDQIEDNDILFTLIREYNSNPRGFLDDPNYKYHGGVFLYNRNCISMMAEWWDRWLAARTEWNYPHTPNFRHWDQYFLYYILTHTQHNLKVGVFKEDARWNFVSGYLQFELAGKQPIICHCTIDREKTGELIL